MNVRTYFLELQKVIHSDPHVIRSDIRFEDIDINECYVSGILSLVGGFELHFSEYVVTEPILIRLKYRYHLQSSESKLVSRWDNAPHHPAVRTFPNHRHDEHDIIHPSSSMKIPDILDAVLQFI